MPTRSNVAVEIVLDESIVGDDPPFFSHRAGDPQRQAALLGVRP